jgi:hypothetical protein
MNTNFVAPVATLALDAASLFAQSEQAITGMVSPRDRHKQ